MTMPAFTPWDWFVLLSLGLSAGYGFVFGLARTLFGLAAWAAALIGTPLLAPMVIQGTGLGAHPAFVWVVLFIALLLLVRAVGVALSQGLKASGLGGVDRISGGLFGVVRALVLIVLVVACARMLGVDRGPGWREAYSRPLLEALAHWIEPFLPQRTSGIRTT